MKERGLLLRTVGSFKYTYHKCTSAANAEEIIEAFYRNRKIKAVSPVLLTFVGDFIEASDR